MDAVVSLPQRIVMWLSTQEDMEDIKFFVEFPPVNKAVPLKRAIVAVGIDTINIEDKFVANDDGVLERQEYCRLAKIKASLSICVPFSYGGQSCHDIFTRIADALTFRTNLNVSESGCEAIEPDHDTDALVMKGWLMMEADFCPAESTDDNYASFLDKELLCGSHIRNDVIHVTQADKEKWNIPFVSGHYAGSGSSKTVNLGFQPSMVFVFVGGMPMVTADFVNSKINTYFAVSTDTGLQGIEVTSTGFKVSNKTNGSVTASLNELGYVYVYIAFK